jgi:hypothetical protein
MDISSPHPRPLSPKGRGEKYNDRSPKAYAAPLASTRFLLLPLSPLFPALPIFQLRSEKSLESMRAQFLMRRMRATGSNPRRPCKKSSPLDPYNLLRSLCPCAQAYPGARCGGASHRFRGKAGKAEGGIVAEVYEVVASVSCREDSMPIKGVVEAEL